MYDGTLYGNWKALVTLQQMIILCDMDGFVDMTPQAIAARTGIPLEIIRTGITALEEPDPYSRTPDLEGRRIERGVTIATVLEFAAAIVLPVIVSAAGHSDWVLPSIAITIGPLLLWLDHTVHIPRYRRVGWALTVGPVILVALMSGTPLIATTGITAGLLLLGTAFAGFRDLAAVRHAAERAKREKVAFSAGLQL